MNQKKVRNFKKHIMINDFINFPELLIINEEHNDVMKTSDALQLAKSQGLDLLVINENGNPPVAKILDYGKYKYEQNKKEKELKKKQHVTNNKEIRLRNGIGDHDIQFKAKKVREFLLDGDRVKISLKFRGREVTRPDFGKETLDKFFAIIEDIGKIDKEPTQNGMFLDMYVVPKK